MRNKSFIWIIFGVMVLVQWYVPSRVIFEQETILENGREYRFLTRPIDPVDPFRGRYVRLRFEAEKVNLDQPDTNFQAGEKLYASLKTDSAGYTVLNQLLKNPPEDEDYLMVSYRYGNYNDQVVTVELPFDKFFMQEDLAEIAEGLPSRSDLDQAGYAVVKILDGKVVLEDVRVNEQSLTDWAKDQLEALQSAEPAKEEYSSELPLMHHDSLGGTSEHAMDTPTKTIENE